VLKPASRLEPLQSVRIQPLPNKRQRRKEVREGSFSNSIAALIFSNNSLAGHARMITQHRTPEI
jgi:hypothetical protein